MTYRLLRHEGNVLAVLRDVELGDGLIIEVHSADGRVVEALHQLDSRTLSTSGGTDESDVGARLDREVEVAQDADTRASGVAEVDVLEADAALDVLRDLALGGLGVDGRDGVDEVDDISSRALGRRHVGNEGEDVAGLDGTEDGGLEGDEEVEGVELLVRDETRTVPEDEGDDEERHGLGQREQQVAPERRPARLAEGTVEALAVQPEAIILTGEGGDGANGSSGFAGKLRGLFVGFLVLLILEDDNVETNETCGDDQGHASKTNETKLPRKDDAEDDTDDKGGGALEDGSEGNTGETVNLLRVVTQCGRELTSAVLILVEELDVLTQDSTETDRAKLARQRRSRGTEHVVLDTNGDGGDDGDDEEVQRIAITFHATLVGIREREGVDGLAENNTEGGVDTTSDYRTYPLITSSMRP